MSEDMFTDFRERKGGRGTERERNIIVRDINQLPVVYTPTRV